MYIVAIYMCTDDASSASSAPLTTIIAAVLQECIRNAYTRNADRIYKWFV